MFLLPETLGASLPAIMGEAIDLDKLVGRTLINSQIEKLRI